MVAPALQHLGIGTQLLKQCAAAYPTMKRGVCVTNKTNMHAQKLYEHLGGTKTEKSTWMGYLYKCLNSDNYIGYEFGENALKKFK